MDSELIFWIVAAVVSCLSFGVLWRMAKKDGENYVDWVSDYRR